MGGEKEAENLFSGINYPIHLISWYEALAFCESRGGRLPSEAEWEYAARGVESWLYPWGNDFDPSLLNYCDASCESASADASFDDGYSTLAAVGSFPENASWVGAYDLLGNVWEWTNSMYLGYPYDSSDGREDFPEPDAIIMETRVFRGLGWSGALSYRTASARLYRDAPQTMPSLGMRCVRDIEE